MTVKNASADNAVEAADLGLNDVAQKSLAALKNSLFLALDQNKEFAEKFSRAMRDVSLEFMNIRLEHAGRAIDRSREWHGMTELLALQHDWMMDIARDYAELTKRVTEVLHDLPQVAPDGDLPKRDNGSFHRATEDRVAA